MGSNRSPATLTDGARPPMSREPRAPIHLVAEAIAVEMHKCRNVLAGYLDVGQHHFIHAIMVPIPYSNEFKRAIDSAILRCSSANPTFSTAIEPVSSDCMPENLPCSASCS